MSTSQVLQSKLRDVGLPVYKGDLKGAVTEAQQRAKYVLIFLHSPGHPDSDHFAQSIITAPAMVSVLKKDFVVWCSSVSEKVGYEQMWKLNATAFPFCAVMLKKDIAMTLQGYFQLKDMQKHLQAAMANTEAIRAEEITWIADREEREAARLAHEAELEEALQIDLKRQEEARLKKQQEEEQRAAEEAERARAEAERLAEEERIAAEEARIQREKEEKERAAEEKRALAMSALPSEEDSIEGLEPNQVATIRVVSLNGTPHERKFPLTAPVDHLYAFAEMQQEYEGQRFNLQAGFPPKELPRDGSAVGDHKSLYPRSVVKMREILS